MVSREEDPVRISGPLIAPEGDTVDRFILCKVNGQINMVGRGIHQSDGGLVVKYLQDRPAIEGDKICSYKERSASGAYRETINGTIGDESNSYPSTVWARYDPLLKEVDL